MRLEATDPSRIVLDLSRLEFIDSTGLAVIPRAHGRAKHNGHSLAWYGHRGKSAEASSSPAWTRSFFLD
jgi:anti-anti-sigma factor